VIVLEVIQSSTEYLARKGVESPRLQSELLLAKVLRLPRLQLYLNFQRTMTAEELDSARKLVKRRGRREPLQHILGSTVFCGLEIEVNRTVLIPRPETESLAEQAWRSLETAVRMNQAAPLVLDWGTGSGCLAIAIAANCASALVQAVDVSPEALAVARRNAERNRVAERIRFWQGDGFGALPEGATFDLIVSNPPYVAHAAMATLQPEVRDYDPPLALDGGVDGLEYHRRLAREGLAFLKPGGRIMVELGDDQAESVQDLFRRRQWQVEALHDDLNGRPRILVAGAA
jgi:release factor glutamine methyltransferase